MVRYLYIADYKCKFNTSPDRLNTRPLLAGELSEEIEEGLTCIVEMTLHAVTLTS